MPRRRKLSADPDHTRTEQTNLLPVMNIMFLLIPGLLLAMETASMAAIDVRTPSASMPTGETPPPKATGQVDVELRADGIVVRHDGETVRELAPAAKQARRPPSQERYDQGPARLDLEGLAQVAGELHERIPGTQRVTLHAENDIEMAELISAMDVLRGPECKLNGSEEQAAKCWFPRPLLQSH